MSVWAKLNQPIGKSGKSADAGKSKGKTKEPAAVAAPAPASAPRKSGRKGRAGKADAVVPAAAPSAALEGPGTATAVLELPVPSEPAPAATPAPTTSRKAGGSSSLAAVNLLSPWVLEELAVRRLRMRFLAGGIALLVLMAGTWGVLRMQLNSTRDELRGDDAVTAGLNQQIKEMSDVRSYDAAVTGRGKDIAKTMAPEVAFSGVLVELQEAMPRGAALTGLTVTLPAEPIDTGESATGNEGDSEAAVCPGADPFGSQVVVACISLSGTANDRDQVSRLVEALSDSEIFVEPFVSATSISTATDDSGVEFEGNVGVSPKARSGRYDPLASSTEGESDQSGEES